MILLPKEMIGIFLQYGQMFLQTTVNGWLPRSVVIFCF
jgi:hypothetical protein